MADDLENARVACAYLFRMAGNVAIDHRRTETRRSEILSGSQVFFEDAMKLGPEIDDMPRQAITSRTACSIPPRMLAGGAENSSRTYLTSSSSPRPASGGKRADMGTRITGEPNVLDGLLHR